MGILPSSTAERNSSKGVIGGDRCSEVLNVTYTPVKGHHLSYRGLQIEDFREISIWESETFIKKNQCKNTGSLLCDNSALNSS